MLFPFFFFFFLLWHFCDSVVHGWCLFAFLGEALRFSLALLLSLYLSKPGLGDGGNGLGGSFGIGLLQIISLKSSSETTNSIETWFG